ncbi:serine protease FAM111A-like [Latimeria chalumnae]|uniref:serine protease FAM111A-like n=1 Tax=Latimeria chalumnae TaxID=7897 RepID=UPI0003C163AF|nr:PREDICTED: protein FAM111A-like [Latimeria chalumnae]XP_006009750.1 PREDICTED: protein FAM111A-like [Latimeria chalumnae]XP_006009751.1 PREDICTED: protein FAM111A-like [Latimeria chalumnae]|eukprot:XP_006009749.1 PREDICTED: protein FAM111A-like [Latimeria chalumnae]
MSTVAVKTEPGLPHPSPVSSASGAGDQTREFSFILKKDLDSTRHLFQGNDEETILSALKKHPDFSDNIVGETVLLAYGKEQVEGIINLGILCKCLPPNTVMELVFLKNCDSDHGYYRPVSIARSQEKASIFFHIEPSGKSQGNAQRRVLRSKKLGKRTSALCVVGFQGESIEKAVTQDGRFLPVTNHFKLVENNNGTVNKIPFNNKVDTLKGRRFYIEVSKSKEKKMQGGGEKDCKSTITNEQSVVRSAELNRMEVFSASFSGSKVPGWYSNTFNSVRYQFSNLLLKPISRQGESDDLTSVEFLKKQFKKDQIFSISVKDLEMLKKLSRSVGLIYNISNQVKHGTCFVIKDCYVMTCFHVIRNCLKETGVSDPTAEQILKEKIRITFEYESARLKFKATALQIEEVVTCSDLLDYAVLKLSFSENYKMPRGLLEESCASTCDGYVYIIGHPEGAIKKIDSCPVISDARRDLGVQTALVQSVQEHALQKSVTETAEKIFLLTEHILRLQNNSVLKYDTCFFFVASGSPVFNSEGKVVALHSGGAGSDFPIFTYGTTMDAICSDLKERGFLL